MKNKLYFLFFISITLHTFSQKQRSMIYGKITDSLGIVKNANIINLTNKQGTFSSDTGEFRIFVAEYDSLQISSVQHQTQKILITKSILFKKKLSISLLSSTYTLNEFHLKRHQLTGSLAIDSKNVRVNKKDSLLTKLLDFSNINMNATLKEDLIDTKVKPPINNVDPTAKFVGAGVGVGIPFKFKDLLLRKKLEQKKMFPYKILSELGKSFFFDELKIPSENYFNFISYCIPLGIEELYQKGKILQVITILKTESISYLLLLKKD